MRELHSRLPLICDLIRPTTIGAASVKRCAFQCDWLFCEALISWLLFIDWEARASSNMAEHTTVQQRYEKWKMAIPYLYDWFANHNLIWPSICCRYAQSKQALIAKFSLLVPLLILEVSGSSAIYYRFICLHSDALLPCRWGAQMSDSTFKWKQGLYMSERVRSAHCWSWVTQAICMLALFANMRDELIVTCRQMAQIQIS